jgi:hypothetical protein
MIRSRMDIMRFGECNKKLFWKTIKMPNTQRGVPCAVVVWYFTN